ncbi:hypothetical protein HJG60_011893 [Phyllostomus discolor]|uniref:Uncharacterized protein n=1 Tax=Phyllostomus discolor TaxID=89673 RepID=A0A833ZPL3_9CHIR|nr:hypothetical protein HJG60_011893 [Phyllostomus discolor]
MGRGLQNPRGALAHSELQPAPTPGRRMFRGHALTRHTSAGSDGKGTSLQKEAKKQKRQSLSPRTGPRQDGSPAEPPKGEEGPSKAHGGGPFVLSPTLPACLRRSSSGFPGKSQHISRAFVFLCETYPTS